MSDLTSVSGPAGPATTPPINRRRRVRHVVVIVLLLAAAAGTPAVRHSALRGLGALLVCTDPLEPGDVVVISESGGAEEFQAAEIEVSDLYGQRLFARVMVLRATPRAIDEELARRGVKIENPVLATLHQLGVPEAAIIVRDAGEGGTTESTQALAQWTRAHPSRVLVVIGAAHSRRYRRALMRAWPETVPPPRVTYPRRTDFHVDRWWTSRRALREGLFELQKLAWDYVRHPW